MPERVDLAGRADADGVAERELVAAEVEQPPAALPHRLVRRRPIPRVGDHHRQIASDALAGVLRVAHDRRIRGQRLVPRAIEVLPRVGVGGRGEHRDVIDTGRERAVEALLVRHQHGIADSRAAFEAAKQVFRVGELRHRLGTHQRRRLDDRVTRVRETLEERELRLGREDALLGLQAVARSDLHQLDARRRRCHAAHRR